MFCIVKLICNMINHFLGLFTRTDLKYKAKEKEQAVESFQSGTLLQANQLHINLCSDNLTSFKKRYILILYLRIGKYVEYIFQGIQFFYLNRTW
jgi:hypothetical protein